MIYALFVFLVAVAIVVWAVKSPSTRLQFVEGWTGLHKAFSVRLAALAGSMSLLIPIVDQVQAMLPQLQTVQLLDTVTHSQTYQTVVGLLTIFIIVARGVKLPPKS